MAATETGDGHQRLATNQVSAAQVAGAVKEETGGESKDTTLVGDIEIAPESPTGRSEHGEEKEVLAAKDEIGSEETQLAAVSTASASVSPPNSSPLQPSSKTETSSESVDGGEPVSTSESVTDSPGLETGEDFLRNENNVVVIEKGLHQCPSGSDVGEDVNMDTTSDNDKETETDDRTDTDSNTMEVVRKQEQEKSDNKLRVSTAHDLDEMMDIGTVDQVEQEAQMNEEECNRCDPTLDSPSPAASNTVLAEDSNSVEEETDVKPTVLPPPPEEVQVQDVKDALSPSSEATLSAGRNSSSPAAMVNGMKVDKRVDTVGAQSVKSSPSPPLVKVKDEPIDEEYNQSLVPSALTASVKDEPNTSKQEDLRIGSVFSVTPPAESQMLPVVKSSGHMYCSNCKKNLIKGQTAYQRKGSPALFCSTACLSISIPHKGVTKICHNCQKVIIRPQEVILAPDAIGGMKDFCSQNCLTSFNYKKIASTYMKSQKTLLPQIPEFICSMCKRYSISKHEVILNAAVHKLCSDGCLKRFCKSNSLSMAGCANCGAFSHKKTLKLKLDESSKTLCNTDCLAKFKEKAKLTEPCTMCRSTHSLSEMFDNKTSDDTVQMFCSSSCVMAFKVQAVSASGARILCDTCGKATVPAYHLAMSDTTIRNFCTLPCVMAFQEKFKSQKQVNIFTKLPLGPSQIQAPTHSQQEVSKSLPKLSCSQCSRDITSKPELIQIKDKMVFVCSVDCSHEFKKGHFVTSLCEYCKMERITRDARRINNKDCFFCSDGCKLLFRHDLTKNWGKHCHSCVYCRSVSKKLVTAQYGNATEEFCSEECRSKYTMLFCHVAKCDTCGRKGKLKQSLHLLGEVIHFCDLNCLLQFCSDKVQTQGEVVTDVRCLGTEGASEPIPVIANVISLADCSTQKSSISERPAQQSTNKTHTSTVSNVLPKTFGHIGIQTDSVKSHPSPAPKILKNKALLCRPLVQNKGVSCRTQTADVEAQTDEVFPKVMVLPVPVPVYVPVPMNMYSQYSPKPVGLPLPIPVPMFLPVTIDSAERIVETIQEIKEKIPSDPFEAELILMAEMVAEQETQEKQEKLQEKVVEKETERQESQAPDDQVSNYSDDLDTDDLASFLNNWEDTSSDAGLKTPGRPNAHEKLNPTVDVSVGESDEPNSEPSSLAAPPMDIEADLTVENLERMARQREKSQQPQSPPSAAPRRRKSTRKGRSKKVRCSQRLSKAAETPSKASSDKVVAAEVQKLKSEYGVDAWKRWMHWRQTQPHLEKPRLGSRLIELKEDVLLCTTAELSYGLCCFITEVKRPNGEPYSPDSLFYLCLGIQQYLFENGRVENIFMDPFYNKFSSEFTKMLKAFQPSITASGYIHSRVEEEYLWDCKQLGVYSPIVLLNTLLFFCCKYFGFTTVEQHRQLSFAHVMRCTKTNPNNTKTTFLRFYPPITTNEAETDAEIPAKKRKEEENTEEVLEMIENTENPLRCPVRLYEFYLSKCSESVKQRTNLFYLQPERCCVPNSPLWFSSTPLDDSTMEAMLIRILTVRELHLRKGKEESVKKPSCSDPPFIPDEDGDEDSE